MQTVYIMQKFTAITKKKKTVISKKRMQTVVFFRFARKL